MRYFRLTGHWVSKSATERLVYKYNQESQNKSEFNLSDYSYGQIEFSYKKSCTNQH